MTTTQNDMIQNILDVFHTVDMADAAAGAEWYADALAFCQTLATETGYTVSQVAGVVAATSPLNKWESNKDLAARIVRAGGLTAGYMGVGLRKCDAILAGADIEATLNGQKIVNFYVSIKTAGAEGVCIDRHAHDIAAGVRHSDASRPAIGKGLYAAISAAYIGAAESLHAEGLEITPAELQSITWEAWRAEHAGTRA